MTCEEPPPHVEGAPDDDQKERLEGFLSELMAVTRKYRILLCDDEAMVEIIDMPSGNLVGLGLAYNTAIGDESKVVSYSPYDSILDGVWLVDSSAGPVEQHLVGNVFPQRDA